MYANGCQICVSTISSCWKWEINSSVCDPPSAPHYHRGWGWWEQDWCFLHLWPSAQSECDLQTVGWLKTPPQEQPPATAGTHISLHLTVFLNFWHIKTTALQYRMRQRLSNMMTVLNSTACCKYYSVNSHLKHNCVLNVNVKISDC